MLPTPSTSHITSYEPAEDSYLLLDTLSSASETSWLQTHFARTTRTPLLLVEPGTGSGVILAFLSAHATTIFRRADILSLGIDINAHACTATTQTVSTAVTAHNSAALYLGALCADLTSPVLEGSVDLLVFNPPYVPTASLPALPTPLDKVSDGFESESHLLSLSYAGGKDGMETTTRLLDALPRVLSERGVAYVLLCAQNRPEEVMGFVREGLGLRVQSVGWSGKVAGWEKLTVLRIWR
ncbi:hypothetical protein EPUS_01748 [Endocarpon pusillum Z07020]|uniref:Methyltransferase small domain-containing protein n=1 Tax=Endocarpon pusillum (strain Z07020 / HMAS-L-300199) TaxID=1263415 RepID=U1GI86_ENDPU|nr:uncharacterized protein EPUS_01748 [Endocarpon pusillum Z07020]ERF71833.1 hypothetical protein EPUS_01748 [Endocarpon pusillum Z07020]